MTKLIIRTEGNFKLEIPMDETTAAAVKSQLEVFKRETTTRFFPMELKVEESGDSETNNFKQSDIDFLELLGETNIHDIPALLAAQSAETIDDIPFGKEQAETEKAENKVKIPVEQPKKTTKSPKK